MIEVLGDYKVLDRIGTGGVGDVYRARDTQHGRTVAIKVLASDIANDPERRGQFLSDARDASELSHPNIAAVYEVGEGDVGEDRPRPYVVSEFVPGEPLSRVIAGRPLNPRRAVDLAVQIADALADAHALGIVHRDLRPGAIIVTPKGNAKILDFGFVWWTAGGAARQAAAMAVASGRPLSTVPGEHVAYMSPEQIGGRPGDNRTDIFSLGAILSEMLTGRTGLARDATPGAKLQASAGSGGVVPSLPRELEPIVTRALANNPDDRYQSAAAMAAELRAVAAMLDAKAASAEPPRVAPKSAGRRPAVTSKTTAGHGAHAWLWIALAVIVFLALLLAWRLR